MRTKTFLLHTKNMKSRGPCETFIRSVGYDTHDEIKSFRAKETISITHEAPITINKRRKRKNLNMR